MKVAELKVSSWDASKQLRLYREHRDAATAEDRAIMSAYYQISRGRVVIQALRSIVNAGLGPDGRPKLAIARATAEFCNLHVWTGGFSMRPRWGSRESFEFAHPQASGNTSNAKALVPLIPLPLRPKAKLHRYHILWEADWKAVPKDPYLLRRLAGDLWLVVAAWDLTDVERAAMATRVRIG